MTQQKLFQNYLLSVTVGFRVKLHSGWLHIHCSTHRAFVNSYVAKTGSYVANHNTHDDYKLLTMAFPRIVKVTRIVPLTTSLLPRTQILAIKFIFYDCQLKEQGGRGGGGWYWSRCS
jgi:hypothetical protein